MDKSIKPTEKSISAASKKSKLNDIRPFTERPSVNRMKTGLHEKGSLAAAELFSQFTANIIKEDTLFTR